MAAATALFTGRNAAQIIRLGNAISGAAATAAAENQTLSTFTVNDGDSAGTPGTIVLTYVDKAGTTRTLNF